GYVGDFGRQAAFRPLTGANPKPPCIALGGASAPARLTSAIERCGTFAFRSTSIGFRFRGSGVRISPSAPAHNPEIKGLLTVSASFYRLFSCCRALRAGTREIKGLQTPTNHSMQHGRNTAVHSPFAFCWRVVRWAIAVANRRPPSHRPG